MTFDWHMLYPLHTVILDNSHVFGGVLCKAQLCNFSNWFFSPRFGLVPIWELWQFCYVRIGPPKSVVCFVPRPPRVCNPPPPRAIVPGLLVGWLWFSGCFVGCWVRWLVVGGWVLGQLSLVG